MSFFGAAFSRNLRSLRTCLNNCFVSNYNNLRHYCERVPRVQIEKSLNRVTLLGRVGLDPQLRGTEVKPVVIFSLATNINYRSESGELQQKTEWHRISIFQERLREVVLEHLKKGSRIYLEGRLIYGEFSDSKGVMHTTSTIVASEIIFIETSKKHDIDFEEDDESSAL